MTNPLQGLRVLNTRPEHQARALSRRIIQAGGQAVNCPALAIAAPETPWLSKLPPLKNIDLAIFISANAVDFFFKGLDAINQPWPETITVIAIGQATAKALNQLAIDVDALPAHEDSEHLLQLDPFQNSANKNILLIKGKEGRTFIEKNLIQNKAQLFTLEVYQRLLPSYDPNELNSIWQNDAVDIILFTSEQGMLNLFRMFGPKARHWLCETPCLVISQRLAVAAKKQGIKKIVISSPTTIFETLCDYNQGTIHGQ